MKRMLLLAPVAAGLIVLAGCGQTVERRAATGGIGGAVAGQVIGGNTGATVAGAVVGAAVGAATTPRENRPPH